MGSSNQMGKLDKVLDMAKNNAWISIDMKQNWAQIFPNDK